MWSVGVWCCEIEWQRKRELWVSVFCCYWLQKKVWKHLKSFQLPKETDVVAEFFSSKTPQLIKCFLCVLQVIWDPTVSLLVNLRSDQPVCDQCGCRPSVHRVCRRHHVRHLQHHLTGGAPQHAHSHDEQLVPAHCCEHRSDIPQSWHVWSGWCSCCAVCFIRPNLGCRIMQTSSGSSPGRSCGWVTLKKGRLCRLRSTSSPAPNHSGTSFVGSRGRCARGGWAPSGLKLLDLSG